VCGDRDHEGLKGLGLAERVHAPEERQEDLLNEIVDLHLGAERAFEHPVHHRREAMPGEPRRAAVPLDEAPRDRGVVEVGARDVREDEHPPATFGGCGGPLRAFGRAVGH